MPRPTSKAELLARSNENLHKLQHLIDSIPISIRLATYEHDELNDRDRTIADVVCHLHEWHNMMQRWYTVGMSGQKPAMPAEGISWKNLPVLNRRILEQYQGTPLDSAWSMLEQSHEAVHKIIAKHSDEELFTKKRYPWTGSTSLGSYLVSATSSHYDWAIKTIRPILRLAKA